MASSRRTSTPRRASCCAPRARLSQHHGVEVHRYDCAANGIFRMQLVYDLPDLTADELRVLPLLSEYLTEFGHGDEDYLAVQTRRALSGNFGTNTMARAPIAGGDLRGWFVITGKGLARKRDEVIAIVNEMLDGARFDEIEHLGELLMQSRAEAEQSLTDRGHQLAVISAARILPRNRNKMAITSTAPSSRFFFTVLMALSTSTVRS